MRFFYFTFCPTLFHCEIYYLHYLTFSFVKQYVRPTDEITDIRILLLIFFYFCLSYILMFVYQSHIRNTHLYKKAFCYGSL